MQRVLRALTSFLFLIAALGFVGVASSSPAAAGPSYGDRMGSSVITSTNRQRVTRDRRAVLRNACLDRMAQSWAQHLAQNNTLIHRRLGRVLNRCSRSYVSENLAKYPVSARLTAAEIARGTVRAWMRSEGHRHNLLSVRPRVIGVGVARTANRRYWIVVQNFAR